MSSSQVTFPQGSHVTVALNFEVFQNPGPQPYREELIGLNPGIFFFFKLDNV